MGKLTKFRRNWSDYHWWATKVAPWIRQKASPTRIPKENHFPTIYRLTRFLHYHRRDEVVDVPAADWDNLIILDAARYDYFREQNWIDGDLTYRLSRGPQTPMFLTENFGDGTYHDIVVISANPHQRKQLDDSQFHAVIDLSEKYHSDELGTVPPEQVTRAAVSGAEEYPQKRLLIHYLQPHAPFISEWAQEQIGEYDGTPETWPYARARRGEVSRAAIHEGYRRNLRLGLEAAERAAQSLQGKTVITSDHGELLGDRAWPFPFRDYGHPRMRATKLLEVPWLELPYDSRRTIRSEPPERQQSPATAEVESRLADLGYR